MKTLFKFTKEKIQLIDKQEVTKDENGKEITITRKEETKVPVVFAITKPDRKLQNAAEIYYNVEFANNLKAGMLTRAMIVKRLANDGGIFTEVELENFENMRKRLVEVREEFSALSLKKFEERTEEEQKRFTELADENYKIITELRRYENAQEGMFNHSAEANAFEKFVVWWVLHLSHKEDGGQLKPLFSGKTIDDKLKSYDEITESEDTILIEAAKEMTYLISFWAKGVLETEDDFEKALVEVKKILNG